MTARDYLSTSQQSVAWIKKQNDDGFLHLRTPFQRNPVWAEAQKRFLIDSIIHSYPVPELYIQSRIEDHDGLEHHYVVDGQQRILACLEFMEGKFALDDDHCADFAGMAFDDLPPDVRKRVQGYKFVVRVLPDADEKELRSIFTRLNRNVEVLTPQELRHATYWGPFIKLMEAIAEEDVWAKSGLFSPKEVRRMADVEFISELAIAALHGPQDKKTTVERWYEVYENKFDDEPKLSKLLHVVPREILNVVPNLARTRWSKKSDYYTLFGLFADRHTRLPLPDDSRADLRKVLEQFASRVDDWLADPEVARVPANVAGYAKAVTRAASDVQNRRARLEALQQSTRKFWQ